MNAGETDIRAGVLDAAHGVALFSTNTAPGTVVKVALGAPTDPPARLGSLALNTNENYPQTMVFDPASNTVLLCVQPDMIFSAPAVVIKLALGQ